MPISNTLRNLLLAGLMLSSTITFANPHNTGDDQGLAIAQQRKLANTGWLNSDGDFTMKLYSAGGDISTRKLTIKTLEVNGDGDKSLTEFQSPADIKGTALLSYSHILDADEQWLYLPQVRRTKRIASKNKSGPFMGSEFAYEDLSSFEVEKYTHHYLNDEVVDGTDCYVVEAVPRYTHSGYTRIVNWVGKQHYRLIKSEYYDRKGALLKTLYLSDYRLHLDKFWRAGKLVMVNNLSGKKTEITTDQLQVAADLPDTLFRQELLSRRH